VVSATEVIEMEVQIGTASGFGDPGRKVFDIGGVEIAVFRRGVDFYAYENVCPHLGGPVCQGKMLPLTTEAVQGDKTSIGREFSKDQFNVACPWHGMEFDIRTGKHPFDKRYRLKPVKVRVAEDAVYVTVPMNPLG
jgi:nitrite reductase/ring-hydroxylating ferredoxin subunit